MSNRRRRRAHRRPTDRAVSVPVDQLEEFFTGADRADLAVVADLEAAGDVAGALAKLRRTARVIGTAQERHLAELVRLGDQAPGWAWGRWVQGVAFRWALMNEDPRVDTAVLAVYAHTYLDERRFSRTLGTRIAAADALVADIVLFDLGVLADYLELRAGPRLLKQLGCAASWPSVRPSVLRLGRLERDRVLVHDLVRDREIPVLHTGEGMGVGVGERVLGRLAGADAEGLLVFAARPVTVGERAGRLLAPTLRGQTGWEARLADLHSAISEGRLENRPGWLAAASGLTLGASLREEVHGQSAGFDSPPAPRQQELIAEGLSRQTAEQLCVLELALSLVSGDEPVGVEMLAQHAGIALGWPEVRREAARRLTDPRHRAAWERLAACLPPHARGPFHDLAAA